jgi:hypothetical protein
MKTFLLLTVQVLIVIAITSQLFSQTDLIPYRKYDKTSEKSMWGFCDKSKKMIVPLKYDFVQPFSEGRALVNSGDKYGFVDERGNEVIPIKYEAELPHYSCKDLGDNFSEGLARVKLNGKWGFIDKNGTEIVPVKYDTAENFVNGLAKVRIIEGESYWGTWGFVNKEGIEVLPLEYDYIEDINEGLHVAHQNMTCGLVNKEGKLITEMRYYNNIGNFVEGFAMVSMRHEVGFINKEGKEVIPLKYECATNFHNGFARVCYRIGEYHWLEGYIDGNGNEYWE